MAGKIFINYRRNDSIGTSGRLYDRLAKDFGRKRIFMDVDHIPAGADFVEFLQSQVAECATLLAIIGPGWLASAFPDGKRRLDSPDDFVRIEIAAALKRDILVIPVLLDGARMPTADDLPDDLKSLARRNAVELRNVQFGSDCDRLIAKIRDALKGSSVDNTSSRIAITSLVGAALMGLAAVGAWQAGVFTSSGPTREISQIDRAKLEAEQIAAGKLRLEAEEARKGSPTFQVGSLRSSLPAIM